MVRGYPGVRCTVARVAGRVVIRFPPISSDSSRAPQDCPGPLQSADDSSTVAKEKLVSNAHSPGSQPALAPASQSGSSLQGRGSDMASQTSCPATLGLATSQPIPQGLDEAVLRTLSNARAPSTRAHYDLKWRIFSAWCRDRQVDPANALFSWFSAFCSLFSILVGLSVRLRCTLLLYLSSMCQWMVLHWGSIHYCLNLLKERIVCDRAGLSEHRQGIFLWCWFTDSTTIRTYRPVHSEVFAQGGKSSDDK